jgi:putative phage-type endonuclease
MNLVQGSEEWLEMRRKKIGASDIPIILGVSPWKTILGLWKEKMGLVPSPMKNYAMSRGILLEEPARKKFIESVGFEVKPAVKFHSKYPWLMASLDGISNCGKYIVEIKCAGKKDHALALTGQLPKYYIPQVQTQIEVSGVIQAYYYSFDGDEGKTIDVERDDTMIEQIIECGSYFYNCMECFIMPDQNVINEIMKRERICV